MSDAFNYFNYYTEIEEHFWRKRGAHILVSPLDWAIVETWQKAGIPVEAVLAGIDAAFESYARSRRGTSGRPLKTLAYCVDAVLEAAEQHAEAAAGKGPEAGDGRAAKRAQSGEPFSREELRAYFERNAAKLEEAQVAPDLIARVRELAGKLRELTALLDAEALDLEDMERRLTVLEEKLAAAVLASADEGAMLETRREMDRALQPYRRKMKAEQLAQLERQYVQKRLFEKYGIPRLSLFYMT